MNKISVEEAKRKGLLTMTHAKIMHKWYDNLNDVDEVFGLSIIGRLVNFEKLDACLEASGNTYPYVVIPDYACEGIVVIIFGKYTEWKEPEALAEKFNEIAHDFDIISEMFTANTQYYFKEKDSRTAMQIFLI